MRKQFVRRLFAIVIASSLMTADASAIVKNVKVWGAKSINDIGSSDYRIEMDDLKEDYSGYLQTDGLTEYFHKDQPEHPKIGVSEAVSWLIDNNIINRDREIVVRNAGGVPNVSISKTDISDIVYTNVRRSDALMYAYKAVFGPLDGRTIGVETPTVRVDSGVYDELADIISKYNRIYGGSSASIASKTETASGGAGGHGGGNVGGPGEAGGTASVVVNYYNDTNKWRYTPQGDEYVNVFGDTNVFISDNDFHQSVNAGEGGGGGGATAITGNASANAYGGGGGGGGSGQAIINYETDYKSIYYIPGADVLFYSTADVIEMYIQAAVSRGVLPPELSPGTQKYKNTFEGLAVDGASLASWSGYADPYIVNMSAMKHIRVENVGYAALRDILGSSYNVQYSGRTLTISRQNLFNSNTGYFSNENLTKMDAYKYIYYMMDAGEKKMSTLEADLVNFKYGLELKGISSNGDLDIIKYLIAKGVLNYDGSNELSNLYGAIRYEDFFEVLYRVANPDARLDFSEIQLTDSEQSWKAKGFYPQTLYIVGSTDVGVGMTSVEGEDITGGPDEAELVSLAEEEAGVMEASAIHYSSGPADVSNVSDVTETLTMSSVHYAPSATIPNEYNGISIHTAMLGGYHLCPNAVATGFDETLSWFRTRVGELSTMESKYLSADHESAYDASNPYHQLYSYVVKNLWFVSAMNYSNGGLSVYVQILDDRLSALKSQQASLDQSSVSYIRNSKEMACLEALKTSLVNATKGDSPRITMTSNYAHTLKTSGLNTVIEKLSKYSGTTATPGVYFSVPNSSGNAISVKVTFGPKNSEGGGIRESNQVVNFSRTVSRSVAETMNNPNGLSLEELTQAEFEQIYLNSSAVSAATDNAGLATYTDDSGKNTYVSWDDIDSSVSKLHIKQVAGNSKLLQNTETGVQAVFTASTKDSTLTDLAIVGTSVIRVSSGNGVCYKDEYGRVWYHIDAVRLLLGISSDSVSFVTERATLPTVSEDFKKHASIRPVQGASGEPNGSVTAISVTLVSDADNPTVGIDTGSGSYFNKGLPVVTDGFRPVWSDFVAVSDASNLLNFVVKRMTFDISGRDEPGVGYAVLTFSPYEDINGGSSTVYGGTMLQDILDAPNKRPEDAVAAKAWDERKDLCNLYANVIYGTTGGSYIETGWLVPHLDFYYCGDVGGVSIPKSIWAPLGVDAKTGEDQTTAIVSHSLIPISDGSVNNVINKDIRDRQEAFRNTSASYWMSADCKILVTGDRLFINVNALDNMQVVRDNNSWVLKAKSTSASMSSFTMGNTFTVKGDRDKTPVTVIETKSDGTVRAQVGPIIGYPVRTDAGVSVVDPSMCTSVRGFSELFTNDKNSADLLVKRFYQMFRNSYDPFYSVEYKGLATEPLSSLSTGSTLLCVGSKIQQYRSNGSSGTVLSVPNTSTIINYNGSVFRISTPQALKAYYDKKSTSSSDYRNTESYFVVEFSATEYVVKDGIMIRANPTSADFLSPELFTSLNNTVISGYMNEMTGAIPINNIEDGGIVQVGNSYLMAQGTSADNKEFVGYVPLGSNISRATLQGTALSFASHTIRAGNQPMNISHFFEHYKLINFKDSNEFSPYEGTLNQCAEKAFANTAEKLIRVNVSGDSGVFWNHDAIPSKAFAPVSIKFQDYLLAYESPSQTISGTKFYVICDTAVSNGEQSPLVDGAFAGVPFFEDSVIQRGIAERTSDVISSGFQHNEAAGIIRQQLQNEFAKLFAGDLITLLRFLVFLVLMWLVLASWVCYACRLSNVIAILEAIRYPNSDTSRKGIDLFKLVSLGTISLDTDFNLGRFIQYNAILAVLLCVVMVTGGITI